MFLSNLINDLAMLSRADNSKAFENLETFSAGELVNNLVRDYQPKAAQKKLALQPQINQALGLITTNQLYVREILQNFLTNAIKYTEKGGITLAAQPSASGVVFSVADTGIGIGKSEQSLLFNKFFRSEDWRVRQITGTGLGLYVSAKLAKLINAKIGVRSELNKGSVFSLDVPNAGEAVQKSQDHPLQNTPA
jgi:signal transduction histidine kinase